MASVQAGNIQIGPCSIAYTTDPARTQLLWEKGIGAYTQNGAEFVISLDDFSTASEEELKKLQADFR